MIDLHSHLIPCIDDGSKNIEESIDIAREAAKSGFTGIFCTSHFMEEQYTPKLKNEILLNDLRERLKEEKININLYCGNEVFISTEILAWLETDEFQTLNNSKYFLLEFPMMINKTSKDLYLDYMIFNIIQKGYTPIIAHPERYNFVQDDPNSIIEFIYAGVLFQMNYGSIIGIYGKQAEKTATILLKNNMVHFFGSDNHRKKTIYYKMDTIISKLNKIIDEKTFTCLTRTNPKYVAENLDIKIVEPRVYKKSIFKIG